MISLLFIYTLKPSLSGYDRTGVFFGKTKFWINRTPAKILIQYPYYLYVTQLQFSFCCLTDRQQVETCVQLVTSTSIIFKVNQYGLSR